MYAPFKVNGHWLDLRCAAATHRKKCIKAVGFGKTKSFTIENGQTANMRYSCAVGRQRHKGCLGVLIDVFYVSQHHCQRFLLGSSQLHLHWSERLSEVCLL